MAEVSYLHLHDDVDDGDVLTLDSIPYWSHDFDAFASDNDFPPSDVSVSITRQVTSVRGTDDASEPDSVDIFRRENQVNFVMDLFHQRVEQSSVDEGSDLLSSDPNLDSNSTHLELDLGLGFCMEQHGLGEDIGGEYDCGFMAADCGDEFFVWRRNVRSEPGESSAPSNRGGGGEVPGGLRVVGIETDSEEENDVVGVDLNEYEGDHASENACDDDMSVQICWDSFQLEDHRDGGEDFEWEEVDGRVDEREVLSMFFDADVDEDLDMSVSMEIPSQEEMGVERMGTMRNLEWEVLLNVHNLDTNADSEPDVGDHDEYNYTAEYEMLIGQFGGNEMSSVRKPPASITVVQNLQVVVLTKEDVDNENSLCAVCKDDMGIGEQAKQLPCSHRYHGGCIEPWLGIRNTCPVCRFELPTDDLDYERKRSIRAGHA